MPTFTRLPVEVLNQIIGELCPYCRHDPFEIDISDVLALASASRFFHEIATPHLYHRTSLKQWWLLARTLIVRPDLARQVRHLVLADTENDLIPHFDPDPPGLFPLEVEEYCEEQFARWRTSMTGYLHRYPNNRLWYLDLEDGGYDSPFCDNNPFNIVISLCPDLRKLDVMLRCRNPFTLSLPNSLPRLKEVTLNSIDGDLDNEPLLFQAILRLFQVAPNLERFICDTVAPTEFREAENDLTGIGPLDRLRFVEIGRSYMSIWDFDRLLRLCPNLEQLHYENGTASANGGPLMLPREIQNSLQNLAPSSLRIFTLNQEPEESDGYAWGGATWDWHDDDLDSLQAALNGRGIVFKSNLIQEESGKEL
ncbi:hypothetical protein QBC35DRAFT_97470 [Podospora australis]|uniref:F-box domain-containing protein n=1 Tax=Podospora australis TaxID=1536484 RepID=A0AAN7ACG5_9PEZI|nr:hypothetical protein QBC35DRAFT_97470 [Podospora australis]